MLRFFHIGFALALSLTALAERPCLCCNLRADVEQTVACQACPAETPAPAQDAEHKCDGASGCCTLSARHDAVSPPYHAVPDVPFLEKVLAPVVTAAAPVSGASFAADHAPAAASRTTLQLICVYRC